MDIEQIKQRVRDEWQRLERDKAWSATNPPTWKPELTEQEREEREQQIKAGIIPF